VEIEIVDAVLIAIEEAFVFYYSSIIAVFFVRNRS